MMKNEAIGTYEVLKGTKHIGFVSAISFKTARAKAVSLFGPFCDVELATNRKARPSDRTPCNRLQQGKAARRYPTPDFEARRAALIAEFEASK
jgi:hypothetical protein